MYDPPDFDFMDEGDDVDFEEQCREEWKNMAADQEMEMMPDDFEEHPSSSSSSNSSSSLAAPQGATEPPVSAAFSTISPHKMYQSPEVFKQLNNEFSKGKRNVAATSLSFGSSSSSEDVFSPPLQQNVATRGPQIQNLLTSCLFTTQLPPFIPLTSAVSQYLDDRPVTSSSSNGGANEVFATITLGNGARKYLRPRRAAFEADNRAAAFPNVEGGMLSRPMSEVLKEAEANQVLKLAAERTLTQNQASTSSSSGSSRESGAPSFQLDKDLWVDKYAPKSFTQLLSSEKINREVLRCIKLWDKFVFNRSTQKAERRYYDFKGNIIDKPDFGYGNKGNGSGGGDGDDNGSQSSGEAAATSSYGAGGKSKATPDTRPEFKLILLAGPPGTGKTTLAHIVARHCGYRTIEVNASDDRSVDSLKDIIARATSNSTLDEHFTVSDAAESTGKGNEGGGRGGANVMGTSKPNCIILDEIDGMDGRQPIDALITIAKAGLDSNKSKKNKSGGGGGNKKGNIVLTRPIICICNDQFSPILRDLRKYAQVFVFAPSTDARLVGRLKQICQQEGLLGVASSSLSALSQASGGDVRSAINTLQFAAMRAQAAVQTSVTPSSATSTAFQKTLGTMITSGLKDERQDVFQLWGQIFSFKAAEAKFAQKFQLLSGNNTSTNISASASGGGSGGNGRGTTHAMRVLDTILGYNDHELVLNGVQENYLGVKVTDPNMIRASSAAEWLSMGNVLEGKMSSGDHSSSKYIPGVLAVVHLLCASDASSSQQRLQYPRSLANYRYSQQQREHILQQFYEGACLRSGCVSSKMVSSLEVVPLLLDVLATGGSGPGAVKPGPMQMQSQKEKDRIQRVVEVMMACGLSYERQTVVDSYREKRSPYLLEPGIEVFTVYDEEGEEYAERRGATATSSEAKHLIYMEVRAQVQKALYAREREGLEKERDNDDDEKVQGSGVSTPDISCASSQSSGVKRSLAQSSASSSKEEGTGGCDGLVSSERPEALAASFSTEKKPKVSTTTTEKKYFSFFKSPALPSASSNRPDGISTSTVSLGGATKKKKALRYKFCSGFSNAVKRPVSIREFL